VAISDSAFANAVYTRLAGQTPYLRSATTAYGKVIGGHLNPHRRTRQGLANSGVQGSADWPFRSTPTIQRLFGWSNPGTQPATLPSRTALYWSSQRRL